MCKRNFPDKKKKKEEKTQKKNKNKNKTKTKQHGTCKRNSPHKNESSTGFVRETPQIKKKPAWDV